MTTNDAAVSQAVNQTVNAGRGPLALRLLWQAWWVPVPMPVPVRTMGFGAWIPFAWRMLASQRWRDAYVLAAYLAAVAAEVSLIAVSSHGHNVVYDMWEFQFYDGSVVGRLGAIGVSIGLVTGYIAAIHALVVFRPSAGFRGAPLHRPLETRDSTVLRAARHRVRRRAAARKLAERLGVGRPDLPRKYDDGGLVDINHAADQALAGQLGMAQHEIDALRAARQRLGRFSSAAELAVYAQLPAHRVDQLRDFVICL